MLSASLGVVMVYVSDMDRSVAFYRDVLGLPLRFASPHWTEFDTQGPTLALHPAAAAPPEWRAAQHAGLAQFGWYVTHLDGVAADLKARGARFILDPQSREGEGIRLAVFVDPDGLPISLAERP
jgi:lactoylglutathione lyase